MPRGAAPHLDDIDIGRRDLHAEGERRRSFAWRRRLRELDLHRSGTYRRERDPSAERGEKIDLAAGLAQLHAQAVTVIGEAAEMHVTGGPATRILAHQRAPPRPRR